MLTWASLQRMIGCGDGEAEGVEDLIEDVDLEVEVD